MDSPPSWSSLRLLVPPIQLMSAFLLKVVKDQNLEHYGKVENIISLATNVIPDLLSPRQKAALIMGLRVKVLLEMCKDDLAVDSQALRTQLLNSQPSPPSKAEHSEMDDLKNDISNLILELLDNPVKKGVFFQRVYPLEYGPDFDKALQVLVCHFISRLQKLLPIPTYKEVSSWMSCASLWEESDRSCQPQDLQCLFQDRCLNPLEPNALPSLVEERIISSMSFPFAAEFKDVQHEVSQDEQSHDDPVMQQLDKSCEEIDTTTYISNTGHPKSADWLNTHPMEGATGITLGAVEETFSGGMSDSQDISDFPSKVPALSESSSQGLMSVSLDVSLPVTKQVQKRPKLPKWRCTQCGLRFHLPTALAVHKYKHRTAPATPYKPPRLVVKCLTARKDPQKEHLKTNSGPFHCSLCKQMFGSLSGLLSHKRNHPKMVSKPKGLSQDCQYCGLTLPSLLELYKHEKTHRESKPYRCYHCDKTFVAKSSRDSHMSDHTGEKSFLCEVCGKGYFSLTQLKSHCTTHKNDRKHVCPHCDKPFSQAGNLKIHIRRRHTGERPFICSTCGKTFTAAGDLQVHTRSHTGERPYKCEVCDRGFVKTSHLKAHSRMHTGERPYSCSLCGKSFRVSSDCKQHMLTHTDERAFKCTVCFKTFKRQYHLNVHRLKHAT